METHKGTGSIEENKLPQCFPALCMWRPSASVAQKDRFVSLRCMMLTAHSLFTPHRTRLDPPRAILSEVAVRKRWDSVVITRNNRIPGRETDGQLQAAALSVRVIYQSASTVPCCALGLPTHAIKQTVLPCYPQSELVSHRIRTNAKFCLQ